MSDLNPDCLRRDGCVLMPACKVYCRQPYDNMRTLPYVDRLLTAEEMQEMAQKLAADWAKDHPADKEHK